MRLHRVQTVILSLLLAILAMAILLGVRLYIEPHLYWRDLWHLLYFIAFQATFVWLITSAPWSARFFALGFVLGARVENMALGYYVRNDLLRSTPGTWTPKGWYPLVVPVQRLFIQRGWASLAEVPVTPMFMGMVLSGTLCGGMMLIARAWWRRVTGQNAPGSKAGGHQAPWCRRSPSQPPTLH